MVLGLSFRTRSAQRDQLTDAGRKDSVRRALINARDSAERERDGLKKRVDEWFSRAVAGLDNSEDYAHRSPEDRAQIDAAETNGKLAQNRLAEVEASIALFDDLLARLDAPRPDETR